jgi:hypothetical protein
MPEGVLCYRYRGYEQDEDYGGPKSRPSYIQYKFCKITDLTDQQKQWLRDFNGITMGDFFAGGCGDINFPPEFLDFLNKSPVWFGAGSKKIVPKGFAVTQMFTLDCIDS